MSVVESSVSFVATAALAAGAIALARTRPAWRPVAAGLVALALLEALDVAALAMGWPRARVFAAALLPGLLVAMAWGTGRDGS